MTPADIVQKLWNYCNVLRDDLSACGHAQAGGMSYLLARCAQASGDYVEQLNRRRADGPWSLLCLSGSWHLDLSG